jgi:hypothetical protein
MKTYFCKTLVLAMAVAIAAAPAYPFPVIQSGAGVAKITVVTEADAKSTNSTSWVGVPGASVNITVPSLKTQLVNVRFSGESACFGASLPGAWCSVRILANLSQMSPRSDSDFAFDSSGAANDFWEAHAMERTAILGPGTYTISVQWRVTDPNVAFHLDDWTMAVTQHNGGH